MTFGQSLQGAPAWYSDLAKELLEKSRRLGSERYVPYGEVSKQRNSSIRGEIDRLIQSQKGNEFDIIPFSITGTSNPININPDDLKNIIENEGFARRVFESATGYHNVSRDEIEGLRQRAAQKFESSFPDIQRLEAERRPTFRKPKLESELNKLAAATEGNIGKKKSLEAELRRLTSQRSPLISQIQEIESRIHKIDSEIPNIESQYNNTPRKHGIVETHNSIATRDKLNLQIQSLREEKKRLEEDKKALSSQIERISSEAPKLESQLGNLNREDQENIGRKKPLEEELQRLTSQRQPSSAAEEEINRPVILKELMEKWQQDKTINRTEINRAKSNLRQLVQHRDANGEYYLQRKDKIDADIPRLQENIVLLEQQRDKLYTRTPSLRDIEPLEPQPRSISPAAESEDFKPQYRGISPAAEYADIERRENPSVRSDPESLVRRASVEREIHRLQGQRAPRIAPMNEYHERAINMMERGFNDDTMRLAANELRESKRHNELKAVQPLIKSSIELPSDEYMNKYVDDYTKDMRKALEDESEEEYIKKIAPKINMSFAQMGAFHSGARAKALKDTLLEHRSKLHREIAHLTGSARDKAMEHHELQKRREQSAAHLLGHTTKSEKDSAKHHAELLRQHAVTQHGMSQLDVASLGQVGKAKQEQEQHEIDVERQEHERQQFYPHEQLARESALISGLPMPSSQTINAQLAASPAPPSLFNVGAGTLATLASGFGGPQQRQYKEGGSVRKKYATGGPIGSSDEIGNEIRKIIQEQGQADQARLEASREHNPIQNWLKHVGREMLSKPEENPLHNLSRGMANSMDHADMMRERASNLYEKIQSTKLNQYKVLAEYENMKEKGLLERQKLAETRRGHDMMREISSQKINAQPADRKKTSTEKKLEDKALENIIENYEMKNDLTLMEDAIKKSTLGTGPWVGIGKSFLGIDNDIDVLGNHIVTKANKLYGRGAGSNLQLKTLQGGKPGQNLSKKANETIIKKYGQESDRRINKNISYLLKSGWSPEEIGAATGIELPNNSFDSLPDKEPQVNNEDNAHKSSIVNMIDPQGNPLEVPEDQMKQALDLGAVLAQ